MAIVQTETELIYNPSSLLSIFTNTLNNEATRKVFRIKGVYLQGNGVSYKGVFYDTLKDEATDTTLTLVVPGLIRSTLAANQIIECNAYLTKKLQLNGGRIELQVNIVDVVNQIESSFSEDQIKSYEILQRKAEIGHKDVASFIKSKIINGEPLTINVIIGRAAIIDEDIKHQLQEAIGFYKLFFIRINLSSEKEIIESLKYYERKCDILAISRGGGDNLEIFNSPAIAEASLTLSTFFITAIGHQQDMPLLQKVADKAFITPTAFGQYLLETYNKTIEQQNNSKAKIINDVKQQLEAHYGKQIQNLNESIKSKEELKEKELTLVNQQLENERRERASMTNRVQELQTQVNKTKLPAYVWILIVVALIIGWVVRSIL